MSTGQTWQINSSSLEDTLRIAGQVGSNLKGGEVIELSGDLGAGKTAFVRGMAKGMGSTNLVRSPSFTISNQYTAGNLTLYHFDFYRLNDPGIMRSEIVEAIAEPGAVVAVEWADIIDDVLPADRLKVRLRTTGEHTRKFIFEYPQEMQYLIQ